MIGQKYKMLTVLGLSEERKYNSKTWIVLCDCGNETFATTSQLRDSTKQSCGCFKKHKRGDKGTAYTVAIGDVYGRLTVKSESYKPEGKQHYFCETVCSCGKDYLAASHTIVKGSVVSCGCKRETQNLSHGMSDKRPHKIYHHMRRRCTNPKEAGYAHYGERGITLCEEWKTFTGFWNDMKEGYSDDLELDRIDCNGNYCKENCRWATHAMQAYNTSIKGNNTSGKTGVSWSKKRNLWEAYISFEKKKIALGHFPSFEDAVKVRQEAELKYYGFTKE